MSKLRYIASSDLPIRFQLYIHGLNLNRKREDGLSSLQTR